MLFLPMLFQRRNVKPYSHLLATKRLQALLGAGVLLVLAGCATTAPPAAARVERMTPAQLAALKPVANPVLSLDEVVAMGRAGSAPADIIGRLRDTQTLHLLTARQIVDLGRQGVDQAVIDYMVEAQEKAREARLLTELADRDAAQARRRDAEAQRRAYEQAFYGYGGFSYGYPAYRAGPGWSGRYGPYFPFGSRRWP